MGVGLKGRLAGRSGRFYYRILQKAGNRRQEKIEQIAHPPSGLSWIGFDVDHGYRTEPWLHPRDHKPRVYQMVQRTQKQREILLMLWM